jgi:hypothetical protein
MHDHRPRSRRSGPDDQRSEIVVFDPKSANRFDFWASATVLNMLIAVTVSPERRSRYPMNPETPLMMGMVPLIRSASSSAEPGFTLI